MSNYTKATDFAAKDALLTGNPSKIVKGTEIDDEFNAIETAIASKADSSGATLTNATFSGTVTTPLTASRALTTNGSSQLAASATTATELGYVSGVTSAIQTQLDAKAPAASPTFTGTVTAAAFTASGTVTFSGLTATTVPYLNASKQFASSAVTPTELGYLSGVSSAIQTQLNAKYGSGSNVSFGTGAFSGAVTMSSTLVVTSTVTASDFTISSDLRKKKDITTIKNALAIVGALDGTRFTYKETGKKSVGFIAQEVEVVLPELVTRDAEGFLSVSYGQVVAVLVEAIKELKAEVDALKGSR